jgi:hypothetical protein
MRAVFFLTSALMLAGAAYAYSARPRPARGTPSADASP